MSYIYDAERAKALRSVTELFTVEVRDFFRQNPLASESASEIRLRANLPSSVTVGCGCIIIVHHGKPVMLTHDELETVFSRLCGGSVYTHSETLKEGFVLHDGIRIGVGGRVLMKDGKPSGFSQVESLNIRIPIFAPNAADSVLKLIGTEGFEITGGILAVSPPNSGKTTFLRALARGLSRGITYLGEMRRFKVCLADERGELFNESFFKDCTADRLELCPKWFAVECATALLSPEIIVCDEIRSEEEANLLLKAKSEGIVLAASCHGAGLSDILRRPHIKRLIDGGAFGTVYAMNFVGGTYSGEILKIRNTSESCANIKASSTT